MQWCLAQAGVAPDELDAVAYSYDPGLGAPVGADLTQDEWEPMRTLYAQRAPLFLKTSLPGLDPAQVEFVPHHVAHAASAHMASPHESSAVLVSDGRGERASYLAGHARGGDLEVVATQDLPHSLGLVYEELTAHLGFRRSSDEYKVMAMASYGEPSFLDAFRSLVYTTGDGGFVTRPVDWNSFAPRLPRGGADWADVHARLAASVQKRLEEVLIELATWLHERTGERALTMAGGVALNCVANSRIWRETPFDDVWVQPASGDSGTALGAAMWVAAQGGDRVHPMNGAALGRGFDEAEIERWLNTARLDYSRPADIAAEIARILADDGVVAWFQGRSEYGPRALGHRSLMADPRHARNLERMNDIK